MNILVKLCLGALLAFSVSCSHKEKKVDAKPEVVKTLTAEAKKDNLEDGISCQVGKDKRVVKVDKSILKDTGAQRCEVHYTKFGEKSQVAWAQATQSLCGNVLANIKTNIEAKGFKCTALEKAEKTQTASLGK